MRKIIVTACLLAATFFSVNAARGDDAATQPEVYGYGERTGSSYLGVDTRDITSARAAELKLKQEVGVEVTMVDQDAPAGRAGVREHDVILNLNGTPLESVEQLRRMIREIPPGRTVTLGIVRSGQPMTIKAQLADRRSMYSAGHPGAPSEPVEPFHVELPDIEIPALPAMDIPSFDVIVHSAARGGMMVENLTPQLGEYFGAKNGQGVLVRSVEKNSPAERAGFRAGDVVVKVGTQRITDTSDWRNAMRAQRGGNLPIGILRDRKAQILTLALPKQVGKATAVNEHPELCSALEMRQVQVELQRMQPEIERATHQARLTVERLRPQIEKAQLAAQRQAQEAQARLRKEMERTARRARREREIQQKQIEQVQHQLRSINLEVEI